MAFGPIKIQTNVHQFHGKLSDAFMYGHTPFSVKMTGIPVLTGKTNTMGLTRP